MDLISGTFVYSLYKNNKILDDTPLIINKIFINLIFFIKINYFVTLFLFIL